jgi:8-oxo-dGTP pyrophosphatase MutT (NUDIX family)
MDADPHHALNSWFHDGTEIPPARPAATIVVVRASSGGPASPVRGVEVLVIQRSAGSRFAPEFVVFPGGGVEDADAGNAARWFGDPAEAPRACAVRELAEETGLAVTGRGIVSARELPPGEAGEAPRREQIPEIGHWVAPEFLAKRFDARFYAAQAPAGLEPTVDGTEAERAWWARADDLLEGQRTGEVQLMWPTFKMLEALSGCGSVEDVLTLHVEQVHPPIDPPSQSRPAPAKGPSG